MREAPKERRRRNPNIKTGVSEDMEQSVLRLAIDEFLLGKKQINDDIEAEGDFHLSCGCSPCVAEA